MLPGILAETSLTVRLLIFSVGVQCWRDPAARVSKAALLSAT